MASLQDIVASVLQDVLSAQHAANLMAESLAEEYKNSPVLRAFPVPAVSVGALDLTFHFAVVGGEGLREGTEAPDVKSLEVIVDSDRLAALGKDCLQTITLKISPGELAAAEKNIKR